ncbi:D-2-hydroxyacid dehydrogenase [Halomonas sp. M20]|uniref:D-2-hydroxyacid dehydrogenase n=1 Tax=Halomonas sp. M20 TaxID=2763264 RepID=UPI001D0AAA5C|nr:D-2-hydroxyacid dehydrogenase [Halomonas sp. M20]
MTGWPLQRVLFLQKEEVLECQKEEVVTFFKANLPGSVVEFAGNSAQVLEGAHYDAIITPTLPWLPEALSKLKSYKWLHFLSSGIEKIWSMPFDKTELLMSKSSGVNSAAMGEYAIGAMLHFAKQFGRFQHQSMHRCWQRIWLDELTERTVTILGVGNVGREVARRAQAFDMNVIGVSRTVRTVEHFDHIVTWEDMTPHLGRTDYLIVCLPLSSQTQGVVNEGIFEALKIGAVVIDISRGGVTSQNAIIDALNKKKLFGAALDVFEVQPLPCKSELWQRDDVLITPHVSGTTPFYLARALEIFLKNVRSLEQNKKLYSPVNVGLGY